jgi:hypothetical protein
MQVETRHFPERIPNPYTITKANKSHTFERRSASARAAAAAALNLATSSLTDDMESLEEEETEKVPNARRDWIAFGVLLVRVVENEKAPARSARAATSNTEERQVNFMVLCCYYRFFVAGTVVGLW